MDIPEEQFIIFQGNLCYHWIGGLGSKLGDARLYLCSPL